MICVRKGQSLMPPVDLSTKTITRLQKHAIPLIDTFDTVIAKLLDAYDAGPPSGVVIHQSHTSIQVFDPAAPPNLAYTSVKSIRFCGEVLPPSETYWNPLMHTAIRKVAEGGISTAKLKSHVLANSVLGKKEDDGYKYLADVGLSVQGQDANGAWKTTYHLASTFHLPLEVVFVWQNNPKATAPNTTGSLTVQSTLSMHMHRLSTIRSTIFKMQPIAATDYRAYNGYRRTKIDA